MHDRGPQDVRRKLVRLMRADPLHPGALAEWMAEAALEAGLRSTTAH